MNNPDKTFAPAGAGCGFENLPALRGLQRLADLRPVVLIDTREQDPLAFKRLSDYLAATFTPVVPLPPPTAMAGGPQPHL